MKKKLREIYRVGIDEAGRGPLAGPVAVGVCILYDASKALKELRDAHDSKKMTAKSREAVYAKIKALKKRGLLDFKVCFSSNVVIDDRGIQFAIKDALKRALRAIKAKPSRCRISLDGGLKAPEEFENQKTIIKGDDKVKEISIASICAKVERDHKMLKFAEEFPQYNFDIHMGYGTSGHTDRIRRYGLSRIHRRSFCKRFIKSNY